MNPPLILECSIRLNRLGRGGRRTIAKGLELAPSARSPGRVPRVSRFMALALRFAEYLRTGHVRSYGELARLGRVSRPRISQIVNLLNLAPDIQEALLWLPRIDQGRDVMILGTLQPIASTPDWEKQRRLWAALGAGLRACPRGMYNGYPSHPPVQEDAAYPSFPKDGRSSAIRGCSLSSRT